MKSPTLDERPTPAPPRLAMIAVADDLSAARRDLIAATLTPLFDEGAWTSDEIPTKTFRDLQWDQLLEHLWDQSQTPEGRLLLERLQPPPDRAGVELRLGEVAEVMELLESDPAPPLGGLRDIRKAVQHTTLDGVLVVEDLSAIQRNCDVAARVERYFKSRRRKLPKLSALGELVDPCKSLRSRLSEAIEPGGQLSDSASRDLARLRRAVQNQHDRISTKVQQLLRDDRFEHALRDDYFTLREDRYVLPIRIGAKGEVEGIVHAYSSSGRTAFIEPSELVELNNQLRWSQIELQEEIDRILADLSRMVASHAEVLFRNVEILAYLDVICAIARFGRTLDASVPTITDGAVELRQARHPLLELKTRRERRGEEGPFTVPNDLVVEPPRRALIVSGPNTGGKTVALKTMGLCAMMTRFGLPLPVAPGSSIALFESIFTDIGDEQSIDRDLSTFSGHVTNIDSFLPLCDEKSLVLLDELFVGTDPVQGAALAVALLEELAGRGTTTVVTTHLEGLKTLAYQADSFANASMGFDLDSLSPTYQMTLGVPGRSYAVRIASRLGLKSSVVERTMEILEGEDHQAVEEVLAGLEGEVRQLEEEKIRLRDARHQAEKREKRFRKKFQELLQKDRSDLFDETKSLRQELRQARDLIRQQLKELRTERTVERGDLSHRDLEQMQRRLQDAEETLEESRDQVRPEQAGPQGLVPVDAEEIEIGMELYCSNFKRTAKVLEIMADDRQVRVQLGDLKATVSFDALFYQNEARRRAHQRGHSDRGSSSSGGQAQKKGDGPTLLPQTSDNSVDLRGLRVDEALEQMELFLDSAYLRDLGAVYIIHGHGTGALKRAVRGNLPQSRYVERFRRGERGEGGDGVTIAFIKQVAG